MKPDYGIDSPPIVGGQLILGFLALALAVVNPRIASVHGRWLLLGIGVYCLQGALGMIRYSKAGKLKQRETLLDLIPWNGSELVLDVGCGRGLLAVGAARRLAAGRAIGVDIFAPRALAGNSPEAVLQNAAAEGVGARVDVKRGDIRELPFEDATFDVAVSNFVLHELSAPADRRRMLQEICRVLKPGGRIALIDFIFTAESVTVLHTLGCAGAARVRIGGWRFWIGAILMLGAFQLYAVTATTPLGGEASC